MADWFVDASIVGGNGTDPASAFASISSIVWAPGDKAWVRNTHYEFLSSSTYLGPAFGTPGSFNGRWATVIGWPQAGDPYFENRPARGTTVGWDADTGGTNTAAVLFGLKMPTFSGSATNNAGGFLLPRGGAVYNCAFQQNNNVTEIDPWSGSDGTYYERYLDNVLYLQNSGNYIKGLGFAFKAATLLGKITMPFSGSSAAAIFANDFGGSFRHLVVHSKTIWPGAIFQQQAITGNGVVELQSSSVGYLFMRNGTRNIVGNNDNSDGVAKFGRICGKQPCTAVASLGSDGWFSLQIDDFYGTGPRIYGGASAGSTRVASINEAACDIGSGAANALIYEINSVGGGFQSFYRNPINHISAGRKYFDVLSGIGAEIRVPLFVDSTGIFRPTDSGLRGYMQAAGAGPRTCNSTNLLVGSPSKWTGSLAANGLVNGSAYIWSCVFTPTESGNVPFEFFLPWFAQANSAPYSARVFFGEPYKV